jgi:hypothetical protein
MDDQVVRSREASDLVTGVPDYGFADRAEAKKAGRGVRDGRIDLQRVGHDPVAITQRRGHEARALANEQSALHVRRQRRDQPHYVLVDEPVLATRYAGGADRRGIRHEETEIGFLLIDHPHPAVQAFPLGADLKSVPASVRTPRGDGSEQQGDPDRGQ